MKHLMTTTALTLALALPVHAAGTETSEDNTMKQATESVESTASDVAEGASNTASDAAQAVENTASDAATAIENTASDAANAAGNAADKAGEVASDAVDATGDATRSALDGNAGTPMEGFAAVAPEEVTADQLENARVYDSKNEWIGEVSKIVMDADGSVDTLVVDVGGFLGIGEKPVGLDFTAFNLQKSVEGNEVRASVKATKAELETMPEYEG
ncbi:PRC-barrel domain-containing protein [Sedimentitalea arenosa]|uniref:PRC-barrel domain-containing protein n=1 Tax=Sedimentitalea arenosa TaxID=2798803 RepID=A0A8J7J620_9RHOB|nr:PRC-barrel domain-containing protein [Arenibacterium arenosum]MBJ6372155.1 PRC-barrel domain-containing protein [Arenibacterium arenosum]